MVDLNQASVVILLPAEESLASIAKFKKIAKNQARTAEEE
jgi:hypothetical protein